MPRSAARNPNPTAAIGYTRVSTEEQAQEGVSLDAQERGVRAYAALRGFDLVELVVDAGVSAGKPLASRNGGRRLLGAVRDRRAGVVLAVKLDRLFRDCAECLNVVREWDRAGIALHLLDLGGSALDTSSAMGRFFLTVMAGAGELERNQIRERTRFGMAEKRRRREYTGGEPPYGWAVASDGVALAPHEGEQEVIRFADSLRRAGLSLRAIGAELAERGYLPRTGRGWAAEQVKRLLLAEAA